MSRHNYTRVARNKKVATAFRNWLDELWRPPNGVLCKKNFEIALEEHSAYIKNNKYIFVIDNNLSFMSN